MANNTSELDDDIVYIPTMEYHNTPRKKKWAQKRGSQSWPWGNVRKIRYISPESRFSPCQQESESKTLHENAVLLERLGNTEGISITMLNGKQQHKKSFDFARAFVKTDELRSSRSTNNERYVPKSNSDRLPHSTCRNNYAKKVSPYFAWSTKPIRVYKSHHHEITMDESFCEDTHSVENQSPSSQSQRKNPTEGSSLGKKRVLLASLENGASYCSNDQVISSDSVSSTCQSFEEYRDVAKSSEPECLVISSDEDEDEEMSNEQELHEDDEIYNEEMYDEEEMYEKDHGGYVNDDEVYAKEVEACANDDETYAKEDEPYTEEDEPYDEANVNDDEQYVNIIDEDIIFQPNKLLSESHSSVDRDVSSFEAQQIEDKWNSHMGQIEVDLGKPYEEPQIVSNTPKKAKMTLLECYCIRVGSYVIKQVGSDKEIDVLADTNGFQFDFSCLNNVSSKTSLTISWKDINQILAHFSTDLNVLFLYLTATCTRNICTQLNMQKETGIYIDSEGPDDRKKIITFLIESLAEERITTLRCLCTRYTILKEVDRMVADEILVKSSPNADTTSQYLSLMSSPVKGAADIPQIKMTYPAEVGGIAITTDDYLRLDEDEFLNDVIIDFYLKYLMREKLSERDRQRTHIFNTFFFQRLTQKTPEGLTDQSQKMTHRHSRVKGWTKNLDIFEKDFIIVPINKDSHWFLAIICYPGLMPHFQLPHHFNIQVSSSMTKFLRRMERTCRYSIRPPIVQHTEQESQTSSNGDTASPNPTTEQSSTAQEAIRFKKMPCILIFDSIQTTYRRSVIKALREYLYVECKVKKNVLCDFFAMPGHYLKVPLQTNFSDCGLYLLQYVENFFQDPIPYFAEEMPQLKEWFSIEKVSNKRKEIKELIVQLANDS